MTRRERLLATLRGEPVDRPPVNFYEISGVRENPADPDPFNVFSDPSWAPLLTLARERTDIIIMHGVGFKNLPPDPLAGLTTTESRIDEKGSRVTVSTIKAGKRLLTTRSRRDPDVNTTWVTEHLLKDVDDFRAWLDLPAAEPGGEPDTAAFLEAERTLGEAGMVMVDTGDPICSVAPLFHMGEFTVMALTEPQLFRRALDRLAAGILYRTEAVARALPGRLWRICGPEYASPPYLPPRLFREYVVPYLREMVQCIQRYGGYARVHCHGRIAQILEDIAGTGCSGLDPIEPPPQGDVQLAEVRARYGRQLVLFGNIEVAELENMPHDAFARRVRQAVAEGTAGEGRGYVLMPTACPAGRRLSPHTVRNYEIMVEAVGA